MKRIQNTNNQSGFTIVELMIATAVSMVILLVITVGVVYFTNSYYKGINSSNTQTTLQNAVDAISQSIEFNASKTVPPTSGNTWFCAGNQVFKFTMGIPLSGTPTTTNAGLYQMNNPNANCNDPSTLSGGTELLGSNMRITALSLSQIGSTNVWNLDLRIAYGDPDLLCSSAVTGNSTGGCAKTAANYGTSTVITGNTIQCKIQTGSQFCSVAELSTAIGQRITQ